MLGWMIYVNDTPLMWSDDLKMLKDCVSRLSIQSQDSVDIRPITTDPMKTITQGNLYVK
jgi:hypothetical protein